MKIEGKGKSTTMTLMEHGPDERRSCAVLLSICLLSATCYLMYTRLPAVCLTHAVYVTWWCALLRCLFVLPCFSWCFVAGVMLTNLLCWVAYYYFCWRPRPTLERNALTGISESSACSKGRITHRVGCLLPQYTCVVVHGRRLSDKKRAVFLLYSTFLRALNNSAPLRSEAVSTTYTELRTCRARGLLVPVCTK